MSALREIIAKMRKESAYLGILFLILFVIFKTLFFRESMVIIVRMVLSIFWLFIIPGFLLMYYWYDKLGFLERLIAGTALGAAVIGLLSYYIALAGLNVKYHWVLPIFVITFCVLVFRKGRASFMPHN